MRKFKCKKDVGNCFTEGATYTVRTDVQGGVTFINNNGEQHTVYLDILDEHFEEITELKAPAHYDNSNGSLYKVASERKWNPYVFDVVKRLERGGKKDPLRQEIEKSIYVLQLWLEELD